MFDNIEDEIMDDAEYLTIVNPILENKEFTIFKLDSYSNHF